MKLGQVVHVVDAGVGGVFKTWKRARRCLLAWSQQDFPGHVVRIKMIRNESGRRVVRCSTHKPEASQ